jgi:DNA-binding NtrC family response regulator
VAFSILIIDDEMEFASSLAKILTSSGYAASYITDPLRAPEKIRSDGYDLLVMDIRMPQLGGLALLKAIRETEHHLPIIMVTGYPSVESAVLAMKYGALNFMVKPLKMPLLLEEIRGVAESRGDGGNGERKAPGEVPELVTQDPTMLSILDHVRKAASAPAPVLILGESGTGKELIAGMIHSSGERSRGPFVKVNCAAIPENLLESELFGHEKGAFTDALYSKPGKFELAHGGTIFLDEIGDMSLQTQAKILRVLQDREFQRVGGTRTLTVDVRVVSASNKDLPSLTETNGFRPDLFYRLSVITISLPPLRERPEDILLLAEHFLKHFNGLYGRDVRHLSEEVTAKFLRHSWPGNVRELKNCIERAVIFCEGDMIAPADLSAQYQELKQEPDPGMLDALYSSLSRNMICDALKRFNGNKQKTSEYLKITRKTLYNKMKKLGLK